MSCYASCLHNQRFFSDIFLNVVRPKIIDLFIIVLLLINTLFPIIRRNIRISFHRVAINIECTPLVQRRLPRVPITIFILTVRSRTHSNLGNAIACAFAGAGRVSGRPRLIIVVHYIHMLVLTAIAAFTRPVIINIIANINILTLLSCRTRTKTRNTTFAMSNHIMMIRSTITSPVPAITVRTLTMS